MLDAHGPLSEYGDFSKNTGWFDTLVGGTTHSALIKKGNRWLSSTLLASGLADKAGEPGYDLENLVCRFTKLGGLKLPHIKVQALVTKPD